MLKNSDKFIIIEYSDNYDLSMDGQSSAKRTMYLLL